MKLFRWRLSRKEKEALQNPGDRGLFQSLFKASGKRKINIRILYPRSKSTEELSVADLLAILLTVCLERVKEGKDDRLLINDVRIDRKGHSTKNEIKEDIFDKSCFVIIILTNDMLQNTSHPSFLNELKLVLQGLKQKSEKMFLHITTCNPDNLKSQKESTKILEKITQGETILSSGLSTTWVENVIYKKYIKDDEDSNCSYRSWRYNNIKSSK